MFFTYSHVGFLARRVFFGNRVFLTMKKAHGTPGECPEQPLNHGEHWRHQVLAIYTPWATCRYAGGRHHPMQPVQKGGRRLYYRIITLSRKTQLNRCIGNQVFYRLLPFFLTFHISNIRSINVILWTYLLIALFSHLRKKSTLIQSNNFERK